EVIPFDEDGNCLGGSFMDYLLPTSLECPTWELGETVTPSPHHPLGCKGVGESATVGSPAAVVNAVIDALAPFGVRHADMPLTPANVGMAMQGRPVRPEIAGSCAVLAWPIGRPLCVRSGSRSCPPGWYGHNARPRRSRATRPWSSPTARWGPLLEAPAPSRRYEPKACGCWTPVSLCY